MLLRNTEIRKLLCHYALSIAFWLPLSLLVGWETYYLAREAHLPVVLSTVLLVWVVRYLTIALLTPPMFYIVAHRPVCTGTAVRRALGYALGYLAFTGAFALIRWCFLPPFSEETLHWEPRSLWTLFELAYDDLAELLLLYILVVVTAHAYTYFVRGRRREIEHLELRHALAQSELQALRVQLHPHFLFNTLQGVSTLIDSDPAAAHAMLDTLATMLRTVLGHGSADLIRVRQELDFVASYLRLQGMRLGKRLQVRWHIEPGAYDALIPQLLLQPLIENAVVHGSASSREGGLVEVSASVRDGRLYVLIGNTFAGRSLPGLGVGIKNTRARLKYLYAEHASFMFEAQHARGLARASLVLPAFTAMQGKPAALPAEIRADYARARGR